MQTVNRRSFVKASGAVGGGLLAAGPLGMLTANAHGKRSSLGYGPLVDKGELWLPPEFEYQVVSRQGQPMSDGQPTPGIFDGMGAFPGEDGTTILIRNHENRERAGEQKLLTPEALQHNPLAYGGNTKLVVDRRRAGSTADGRPRYEYRIVRDFAILGGTSTNCAGGLRSPHIWITCEEVVKRLGGVKHGYIFEIDARAEQPVAAIPVPQAGRRAHEAAVERAGVIYMSEDRGLSADPVLGTIGSCLYRYTPRPRGNRPLHRTSGPLEALKIAGEYHANMDTGREVGRPYPVEWVPVPEPDHDDDTDDRRDRVSGFTPNRVAAQDNGAAYFDRMEGMWVGPGRGGKVYFDCTTGGPHNLGQVWEYDAGRETVTLIYESNDVNRLENPDNVVVVPHTHDVFLCEDSDGDQYVRGVTADGAIYDFAKSATNQTEFCGACFSPDGSTLFLNQQGERGALPSGPSGTAAVTYAIYGPWERWQRAA